MYQQTVGGALVFYSGEDFLVFFTVFCSVARRLNIAVLSLCPMVDHIHCTVIAPDWTSLSAFVQQYTHLFAWEWNVSRNRKGSIFKHRFGSAVKRGNKSVRSTLNYNYNNPVERKLVDRAEQYRWNFLQYARSAHPFSAPLVESSSPRAVRAVMREIRSIHDDGTYLRYTNLRRWSEKLTPIQMQQIGDYVIGLWNVIDYDEAMKYYGNYDVMIRTFHDNTGGEYDIKEEKDPFSDAVYAQFTKILLSEGLIDNVRSIPCLNEEKKLALFDILDRRTGARPKQIRKYLHLMPPK